MLENPSKVSGVSGQNNVLYFASRTKLIRPRRTVIRDNSIPKKQGFKSDTRTLTQVRESSGKEIERFAAAEPDTNAATSTGKDRNPIVNWFSGYFNRIIMPPSSPKEGLALFAQTAVIFFGTLLTSAFATHFWKNGSSFRRSAKA